MASCLAVERVSPFRPKRRATRRRDPLTQHPDDKPVPGGEAKAFRVALPESVLADLRERLERTRWPDETPGSGWGYGMSLPYAKELAAYWKDGYDWRAQEARLNAFEQYTVPLGGIDLHFIHERGAGEDPLDRKSTRLNSSHANISYAVFCLKKKKIITNHPDTIH